MDTLEMQWYQRKASVCEKIRVCSVMMNDDTGVNILEKMEYKT